MVGEGDLVGAQVGYGVMVGEGDLVGVGGMNMAGGNENDHVGLFKKSSLVGYVGVYQLSSLVGYVGVLQ